jgi:hypothetical protein
MARTMTDAKVARHEYENRNIRVKDLSYQD